MPVEYIRFSEAKDAEGLRMVVVSKVPSPWTESAKGILHIKKIPYRAVRLDPADDAMAAWTGSRSAPAVLYDGEKARTGWDEILLLAERLEASPRLVPEDPLERALMMGLAHEICGEAGLGWSRRLAVVSASHTGEIDAYPRPVAKYLGKKYGFRDEDAAGYRGRVVSLLQMLTRRLDDQRSVGSGYYLGTSITAVDVYSATFMGLFKPLPQEQCAMMEALRPAFESMHASVASALSPILIEHRDYIYERYLETPLSL